jgi:hypothetical protein
MEICSMAKLVFGLNQSLDGYVEHMKLGPPVPAAFRHFVDRIAEDLIRLTYAPS